MFPLRDENPTNLTPVVTVVLIAANVATWILVQGAGGSTEVLANSVCNLGLIPAELTGAASGPGVVAPGAPCTLGGATWLTLFTSMFLHGGWFHLIGNMWFLWIFGNNIEDSLGHLRFLVFYVLCGLGAAAAQIASHTGSLLPMVGASGAISGVMGGYLLLYPRVRVQTLFIFVIFLKVIAVPAWLILILWLGLQIVSGYSTPVEGGGVAFWAHTGGFIAGVLLVKLFENRTLVAARRQGLRLSAFEVENRGWL